MRKTTAVSPGDVIFTLPAAYRPATRVLAMGMTAAGVVRLDIDAAGNVMVQGTINTADNWVSMHGIYFRTD